MANVLKWLKSLLKLPQYVNRIGNVKFAQSPINYLTTKSKEEVKGPILHNPTKLKA
jgi:hypothetical protein